MTLINGQSGFIDVIQIPVHAIYYSILSDYSEDQVHAWMHAYTIYYTVN